MNKKKCPICGTEMKIDTSAVCVSIPPKFRCVCPSCNCLDFIKTSEYDQYKEEPSLPSDLDEAAEEYAEEFGKYLYGISTAFKAGAEWMAGQGITIEKVVGKIDDGYNEIPTYCNGFEVKETEAPFLSYGDKIIVQIRKKNE